MSITKKEPVSYFVEELCGMDNSPWHTWENDGEGFKFLVPCESCDESGEREREDDDTGRVEVINCPCCSGEGEYWLHFNNEGQLI